jgi:hypothetical protein
MYFGAFAPCRLADAFQIFGERYFTIFSAEVAMRRNGGFLYRVRAG